MKNMLKRLALLLLFMVPQYAAAQVASNVTSIPSITALKALGASAPFYQNVSVVNVGLYAWHTTCPGTPNDAVYIQPTGTTGCYSLNSLVSAGGGLSPLVFGAVGNALTCPSGSVSGSTFTCTVPRFTSTDPVNRARIIIAGAGAAAVSSTVTMTCASPVVVTWTSHQLVVGTSFYFTTTGSLCAGLSANTQYYVIAAGYSDNTFRFSTTVGGSAVNASGSQSGTQTANAGGATYVGTIATYVSSTQVTLSSPPTQAVSGAPLSGAFRAVFGHDDSAAIQAAVNVVNAGGGGTVLLPAGYNFLETGSGINMLAGVTLKGPGKFATTLYTDGWGAGSYNQPGTVRTNMQISDFTIDCACDNNVFAFATTDKWLAYFYQNTTTGGGFPSDPGGSNVVISNMNLLHSSSDGVMTASFVNVMERNNNIINAGQNGIETRSFEATGADVSPVTQIGNTIIGFGLGGQGGGTNGIAIFGLVNGLTQTGNVIDGKGNAYAFNGLGYVSPVDSGDAVLTTGAHGSASGNSITNISNTDIYDAAKAQMNWSGNFLTASASTGSAIAIPTTDTISGFCGNNITSTNAETSKAYWNTTTSPQNIRPEILGCNYLNGVLPHATGVSYIQNGFMKTFSGGAAALPDSWVGSTGSPTGGTAPASVAKYSGADLPVGLFGTTIVADAGGPAEIENFATLGSGSIINRWVVIKGWMSCPTANTGRLRLDLGAGIFNSPFVPGGSVWTPVYVAGFAATGNTRLGSVFEIAAGATCIIAGGSMVGDAEGDDVSYPQ